MNTIATNLRRARLVRGLTGRKMAQMLDVSESQLAKWESGRTTPRAKSLTMYVELGLLTPGQALGLDPVEAVDATGEEDAA